MAMDLGGFIARVKAGVPLSITVIWLGLTGSQYVSLSLHSV